MASRRCYFFFYLFFIFLYWAEATKEVNKKNLKDLPECRDAVPSIACGELTGENCFKYSCYTFNTTAKTWKDSQKDCAKNGGYLVSIETKEELIFLQERIKNLNLQGHNEWYIGLSVEESPWEWLSGKPLTIEHWQRSKREPTGDVNFVKMAKNYPPGHYGSFADILGTFPRGYICETNITKARDKQHCLKKSCYRFSQERRSWENSRRDCQYFGGDLVSIETESEWSYINNVLQSLNTTKDFKRWSFEEFFIGLKRKPLTSWKWTSKLSSSLSGNVWLVHRPRGRSPYTFMGIADSSKNPVKIFGDAERVWDIKPYICENSLVTKLTTK